MVIDTNLERMYVAGKRDIPQAADKLSRVAARLHEHLRTLDQQAALAGDPPIMTSLLRVGGEVYDVLRGGVVSLNNAAAAMIATADDLRTTDQDAREDFARMDGWIRDLDVDPPAAAPPALPDPEAPGAEVPTDAGGTSVTPSTPDPGLPAEDAGQRGEQEQRSEFEHERIKRRG